MRLIGLKNIVNHDFKETGQSIERFVGMELETFAERSRYFFVIKEDKGGENYRLEFSGTRDGWTRPENWEQIQNIQFTKVMLSSKARLKGQKDTYALISSDDEFLIFSRTDQI